MSEGCCQLVPTLFVLLGLHWCLFARNLRNRPAHFTIPDMYPGQLQSTSLSMKQRTDPRTVFGDHPESARPRSFLGMDQHQSITVNHNFFNSIYNISHLFVKCCFVVAVLRGLSGYVLAAKNRWKGAASDGFHLICQQMSGRRPSSLNTFAFVLHHFRWTVSSLSSLQDFQRPANQNSCQEHKKPDRLLARIFSIPLVPHLARNFHIYIYVCI